MTAIRRLSLALLVPAALSCSRAETPPRHPMPLRDPAVAVVSARPDAVLVEWRNGSEDIVVLSPGLPNQSRDEERCVVKFFGKIDENILPYAFTPELMAIRAGQHLRFYSAIFPPGLTSSKCPVWTIEAEYAYIDGADVEFFRRRDPEEFRQHVLKVQRVIRTTGHVRPAKS